MLFEDALYRVEVSFQLSFSSHQCSIWPHLQWRESSKIRLMCLVQGVTQPCLTMHRVIQCTGLFSARGASGLLATSHQPHVPSPHPSPGHECPSEPIVQYTNRKRIRELKTEFLQAQPGQDRISRLFILCLLPQVRDGAGSAPV